MADKPKPVTFKLLKVDPAKYSILWRAHTGRATPGPDDPLSAVDVRMACLLRLLRELKFVAQASYSLVIGQLADYIRDGTGDPRLTFFDRSAFSVGAGLPGDPAEIIELTTGRTIKPEAPAEELTYAVHRWFTRCVAHETGE